MIPIFRILDRYYLALYRKNREKFLAQFQYKVALDRTSSDVHNVIIPWLSENVGKIYKDYRIEYSYNMCIFCFKNQNNSTLFALRWTHL